MKKWFIVGFLVLVICLFLTACSMQQHTHTWDAGAVTTDPTCTVPGVKTYTCSGCGETKTETIPTIGHTVVTDAAVEPTCVCTGLTEGTHCTVCNRTLVKQSVVSPKAHTLGDWIVDKDATHEEAGSKHKICTMCKETIQTEAIPRIVSVGLAYEINTDGLSCTITGIGSCSDTEIWIPDAIDGYPVKAIGANAFKNCKNITAISLANSISRIEQRAFCGCEKLKQFTIPSSVNFIGTQIFLGCTSLGKVYYNSYFSPDEGLTPLCENSIKEVIFGDNITLLPDYICYGCGSLQKVTLPSNLVSIGNRCFYECTSLRSIEFPNTIRELGWYSFEDSGLNCLIIPDSVLSITNTFRGCQFDYVVLPNTIVAINNQSFYCCSIQKVYYMGDELDWSGINIGAYSDVVREAHRYYYSENKPNKAGFFWHYVDGKIVEWN